MKKILTYVIFIIAGLLIVVTFITSTTYTQLAIASLLYPPLAYFAFKFLPLKSQKPIIAPVGAVIGGTQPINQKVQREGVEIVDFDKRAFLKLIGATGFSFFLFSLFTRRVEDLILGRSVAPIAPSNNNTALPPTDSTQGYRVSEIDNGEFNYYGFINKDGGWYIMKEDPTVGSFRYAKEESNFTKNWSGRNNLKYEYFHNVFE